MSLLFCFSFVCSFSPSHSPFLFFLLTPNRFRYVQLALATPVVFYCGKKFFVNAYKVSTPSHLCFYNLITIIITFVLVLL